MLPAGTLSGAPKLRAMQIIDRLENKRRGLYGGGAGYIDFSGNLDICIATVSYTHLNEEAFYLWAFVRAFQGLFCRSFFHALPSAFCRDVYKRQALDIILRR